MGTAQRHTIRRLLLEVDTGEAQATARERQAQLAALCRERLPGLLDRILGASSAPHLFVQIERLELDLGEVDLDHLDRDWASQLEPRLREALEQALRHEQRETKTTRQTVADLLLFFLKTGRLPWWVETPGHDMIPDVLRELSAQALVPALHAELGQVLADPAARLRLARHANDVELTTLLRQAAPLAFTETVDVLLQQLRPTVPDWPRARQRFWDAVWIALFRPLAGISAQTLLEAQLWDNLPEARTVLEALRLAPHAPAVSADGSPLIREEVTNPTDLPAAPPGTIPEQIPETPFDSEIQNLKSKIQNLDATPRAFEASDRAIQNPKSKIQNLGATPRAFEASDHLYLYNAGLVLLAPYLPHLWERLGWVQERQFTDPEARFAAIQLLQFLCDGQDDPPEYLLDFPKILCGLSPEAPYAPERSLPPEARAEGEALLEAVLEHAPGLGLKTVDGLRGSFLLRKGVLRSGGDHWLLHVEKETYDLVLQQIPWSFQIVKHPWMDTAVLVDWTVSPPG